MIQNHFDGIKIIKLNIKLILSDFEPNENNYNSSNLNPSQT